MLFQHNPYYILDEPFNSVDIQSNIIILEIMRDLKRTGKTLIICSHIFSTLNDICDEILLLENGQFGKNIYKEDFLKLEQQMRQMLIGNRVKDLEL